MSQTPLSTPISTTSGLDLTDIQGDIILGIPKRFEDFLFFSITNPASFKKELPQLIPAITSTADVVKIRSAISDNKIQQNDRLIKVVGINVGFSFKGIQKLGITDDLGDPDYNLGQLAKAQSLGDPGTTTGTTFVPAWRKEFLTEIDGVFLFAGDCKASVDEAALKVEHILGNSINKVLTVNGNVRPGSEKGHEHFGYLDGISSPCIASLTTPLPGQQVVDPGVLLLGQTGDPVTTRPSWAKNGSFLVYRHLKQLVPEFNKFVADNPIPIPGLPRDKGSELLGARFFGRWKSGAPIDITPFKDDPVLAADPQRNNNFDFSNPTDQTNCPFAAHIRKTNPRSDLAQFPGAVAAAQMNRTGIPFGPELDPLEITLNTTQVDRGLAFVCYQSQLEKGFEFVQQSWANNPNFPPKTVNGAAFVSGFDPIIGQNGNNPRIMAGTNPGAQTVDITLPTDFVVAQGGEYFFSPSISALKSKFVA